MLPFLKPRRLADTIIASRSAKQETKTEQPSSEQMMKQAEALISAIHDKDATRVASILSALTSESENESEQK